MSAEEWLDLISYVSDLGSLLDLGLVIDLDGDSLRVGLDGASIRVSRTGMGWAIAYESEGVRIRVEGGEAEYCRGGELWMRGVDSGACRRAAKAFALIVGLAAAHSFGSEEQLFKRFFKNVEVVRA